MADGDGRAAKLPQKVRATPAHSVSDAEPEGTSPPLPVDSSLLGAAAPPQDGGGLQRALARADGPERVRIVRQLQRSQGNAYVQHLIAPVQRAPTAAPPAAPQPDQQAAAPAETWSVPAGLVPDFIAVDPGPITQKGVAAQMLFLAASRMTDLKDELDEAAAATLQSAINGVQSQRQKLAVDGNLTHSDVVDMNVVVPAAKSAFDTALQTLRATISQTLTQMLKDFGSADTSVAEEAAAEKMHMSFIHGAPPEEIEKGKKALEAIKGYKEKVDSVSEWAGRLSKLAGAAKVTEFIENFGKKSKTIGEGLSKLGTVLDAAELLATLTSGHGGQTGPQESIKQARVGLKALDVGMGVAGKIFPIFGTLWSSYYSPMTKACIDQMQKLFDIQDAGERRLTVSIWWAAHEPPTLPPPDSPDNIKIRDMFPGGQPVLTFMYNLVNGGNAAATPAVEQYFISRKDLFNAGEDEKDKLKSESSSHWYDPTSWGAAEKSPNLMSWVTRHADTVWAQLYGSLPHSLRSS